MLNGRLSTHPPCDFCTELSGVTAASNIETRPKWVSRSLAIMPTIGPLTQGHLLFAPRRHVTSFGQLSSLEWSEVVAAEADVAALLTRQFGATIAFEHGTSGVPSAGGCGIDHAHMHFVPVAEQVMGLPPVPSASWLRLDSDWSSRLQTLATSMTPYVYMRTVDGARFATPARSLPSQFVRRWVAELLGTACWDWRESNPVADFAEARRWMAEEIPPSGFSALGELAEATL